MSDLLLPGDERADALFGDRSVMADLLAVEESWSAVLAAHAMIPGTAALAPGSLDDLVSDGDVAEIARTAETAGNPVVPLVALLRSRLENAGRPDAARFLHRGLTSQDTIDTAMVLGIRRAADRILSELRRQAQVLSDLATRHRDTIQTARTLTQPAVPTTFGLVTAGWLDATLDNHSAVRAAAADLPAQVGGAAGTLSAITELARDHQDPSGLAVLVAGDLARRLRLAPASPWHTQRRPLTHLAGSIVACCDSWGIIAGYVLTRSRPEIGELREGTPGGSSTMPHKANPVLSVLIRRAALTAPAQLALLHTAAALGEDERSPGPWHSEWPALRTLARTACIAAAHTSQLLTHLVVDAGRMRASAEHFVDDLLAEQRSIRHLLDAADEPQHLLGYLGAAGRLIDAALARPLPSDDDPVTA